MITCCSKDIISCFVIHDENCHRTFRMNLIKPHWSMLVARGGSIEHHSRPSQCDQKMLHVINWSHCEIGSRCLTELTLRTCSEIDVDFCFSSGDQQSAASTFEGGRNARTADVGCRTSRVGPSVHTILQANRWPRLCYQLLLLLS